MYKHFVSAAIVVATLTTAGCDGGGAELDPEGWRTFEVARQPSGEAALDVRFDYAAGRVQVQPAEPDLLYSLDMRYHENVVTPVHEYDPEAGRLVIRPEGRTQETGFRSLQEAHASLELNPEIPVTLAMDLGAVDADLRLGGLAIQALNVSTGASRTRVAFDTPNRVPAELIRLQAGAAQLEAHGLGNARADRIDIEGGVSRTMLDFSGEWTRDASANVELGMGALELRLPRDLGVRIDRTGSLSRFRSTDLVQRGDSFFTQNWDEASHRLTLRIDAGMGAINVEWIN